MSVIPVLFLLDELLYLRVVLSSVFVRVCDAEEVLLSAYVCRHKLLSVSVSQHPFSTPQCLAFWHTQVMQTATITLSSMCVCVCVWGGGGVYLSHISSVAKISILLIV